MILYRIDMSDTIDYIDDYFTGALSDVERKEFETRCTTDEAFASEVAFYVSARHSVRNTLLQQKKEQWREEDKTGQMTVVKSSKKPAVLRWISYAAAACVVFIIAGYFLFFQPTPQRLAEKYLDEQTLSQLMDASHDSLQAGIADFKSGQYEKALATFNDIRKRDAQNSDAKEYAGLSYLKINDYDKALNCFRDLSSLTGLQSNPGDILQATTLLKRDQPGDDREAKQLLEKVVKEDEEGSKEAKEILAHW